jgi:hypothetical protein
VRQLELVGAFKGLFPLHTTLNLDLVELGLGVTGRVPHHVLVSAQDLPVVLTGSQICERKKKNKIPTQCISNFRMISTRISAETDYQTNKKNQISTQWILNFRGMITTKIQAENDHQNLINLF